MPSQSYRFFPVAAALAALATAGCQSTSDKEAGAGGSRLDPTSSTSRAKLDAAQAAFGGSSGRTMGTAGSEFGMKAFRSGGRGVAMPTYRTKGFRMKPFPETPAFRSGSGDAPDWNRSFRAGGSAFQTKTSPFSRKPADVGGGSVAARGFGPKAYRGRHRGTRIREQRAPVVTQAGSLVTRPETGDSEAASVSDIRKLLNR